MTERGHDEGFLARWSRRKAQARREAPPAEPPAPAPPSPEDRAADAVAHTPALTPDTTAAAQRAEPPPSLADVAALTPDADFARFVAHDVAAEVKNAALKKLFADPRFNVMDGLDVYIDDYSRPDPIPAHLLAEMAQARAIDPPAPRTVPAANERRVAPREPDPVEPSAAADATPPKMDCDEDADLRLQPHDAARCAGAEPGTDGDGGREQRRAG